MMVFWEGKELPRITENAWQTPEGEPFSCSVLTADLKEYTATISFNGTRWVQKATSPQGAVDGATRKAARWAKRLSQTLRWLAAQDSQKPRGAPHGVYTVAKTPDSPEQEEWIRKKREQK